VLRYVYGHDQEIGRFVAWMIPHVGYRGFNNYRTIGVVNADGQLIAGILYNNWNTIAGTIDLSAAALPKSGWLTRETVQRMHDYPFDTCGCQMLVTRVLADNEALLRQLAVGYSFVKVPRLYGRGQDGVICTLTAEEWAASRFNRRSHLIEQTVKEAA